MQVLTLTPPPEEVSDLLVRMTRLEWPTTDDERLDFFAALGLRDTGPGESTANEPDSAWHSLGRRGRAFTGSTPSSARSSWGSRCSATTSRVMTDPWLGRASPGSVST